MENSPGGAGKGWGSNRERDGGRERGVEGDQDEDDQDENVQDEDDQDENVQDEDDQGEDGQDEEKVNKVNDFCMKI